MELLSGIFSHSPENPWLQEAMLCSVSQGGPDLLASLAADAGWSDTNNPSIISRLALSIGLQSREAEARQVVDDVASSRLTDQQAFTILAALGEGLRLADNSLAAADPQNRLQRFYDRGLETTFNDSLSDQVRIPAIRFRSVSPVVDYGTGDILQLLFGTSQSDAVQSATLSTLALYANPAVPGTIFQRWPELTPRIRSRALSALLTRGDWAEQLIAAAESGQIRPGDFSSPQLDLLRNWPEKRLSDRAIRVFGSTPTRRPQAVDAFADCLTMAGSRERGRDIYLARCVSCHRAADGRRPMPFDLAHLKSWPRERILSTILEPNADVHAQWGTYFVQNKAGEIWAGTVIDDNSLALTLQMPAGQSVVLPRGTVHYVQLQSWSLMPAGLETGLTQQNMADLIEFLCPR
jgi:putative heme-binding domain-containing protein